MEYGLTTEHLIDVEYKDNSPIHTVDAIKSILKTYGIETEEYWRETHVPYCYALSVIEKKTGFCVNGKGLTKELALASGYGEFMERLQLGFIGKKAVQKDGAYAIDDVQSVKISANTLFENNRCWYEKMAQRLQEWNGNIIEPIEIITQYADADGNVETTPFVNLINGKTEYLPSEMRKSMYTSNGCAAGNSIEEAIVQALSEIVERYYRLQIIYERICTPEIPDEKLKQYHIAYNIISYVRQQGYKVVVRDCSLGEKFPVVCVCYIDEATGRYHTHFGAYPVFEIALERALTETFQGRSIGTFASYDELLLDMDEKGRTASITQELIMGTTARTPEFFVGPQEIGYNEHVGFTGKNNKELLKECIEFFSGQGYDVLVRNAASLGFPTCQVIVPGYSETYIHRISIQTDENRYLPFAVRTFRNPGTADVSDIMGTLMHMREVQTFYGNYKQRTSFSACAKLMADISEEEGNFLQLASLAHVYYTLGNMPVVEKNLQAMLKQKHMTNVEYLICLSRYMSMRVKKYPEDMIRKTLHFLHREETVEQLCGFVDSGKNPLDPLVLHCDMQCDDACVLKSRCRQKEAQRLINIVNSNAQQLSFDEFSHTIHDLMCAKK